MHLALSAAEIVIALVVCLSALALGGAHVYVVLAGAGLVLGAGVLSYIDGSLKRVPGPAWVLLGLGAYTLVQSAPLPLAVLRVMSPHAADVWARALVPLREPVTFGSMSVDPGASSVEAAKWCSYAIAFSLAAGFGRRAGASPVSWLIFGSAMLVAAATLGHSLVGATSVFGVYTPRLGVGADQIGPILNSNCLAGFLLLGCLSGFGLMLGARDAITRWLWALGVGMLATAVVLAGSRGGVVALGAGIFAFAIYLARSRDPRILRAKWQFFAALSGAMIACLVFAMLAVRDSWFSLSDRDVSKLRMGMWIVPLLKDYPLFGVGRGAFDTAFPEYKQTADNLVYANPENIVAQWFSEWGIAASCVSALVLAWQFRPSRIRISKHVTSAGALIGVGALILQNLVDFSLELFAHGMAVSVVLGSCWGQRWRTQANDREGADVRNARALLALGGIALCGACIRGGNPVAFERLELQDDYQHLAVNEPEQVSEFRQHLRAAMLRHPAEPYFARLGALVSLRTGRDDALAWVSRALERCPVDSRTHWLLANALARHGKVAQALLEARLAVEYDAAMSEAVGRTVVQWTSKLEDIRRAAPRGRAGARVKLWAAASLPDAKRDWREVLAREAVQQDPKLVRAHLALAEELLAHSDIQNAVDTRELFGAADAVDRLAPDSAEGSELRARVSIRLQQFVEARRALESRCPGLPDLQQVRCWKALLSIALAQKDPDFVAAAADRLVKAACVIDADCDGALISAGDSESSVGRGDRALAHYEEAVRRNPSLPGLLRVADSAAGVGDLGLAARALAQAASRARRNPEQYAEIERKRQELFRRSIAR